MDKKMSKQTERIEQIIQECIDENGILAMNTINEVGQEYKACLFLIYDKPCPHCKIKNYTAQYGVMEKMYVCTKVKE